MDPRAEATSGGDSGGWRRALGFRAFALGVGVSGGLLAMELAARLVLTDFYACEPGVGWTFEPGRSGLKVDRRLEYAVPARINSAGFHDVEHALEKPPGTQRVALVGDSMLAGMQVALEHTFARRLEARLNRSREGGPAFEVVNCAVDGFGTAQALLLFEERCRRYRPDLVLLGFFSVNDVLDNAWGARSLNYPVARKCGRPYFALEEGRLVRVEASLPAVADPATGSLDRALRRSYLYQVVAPPPGRSEAQRFRLHDVFRREWAPEYAEAWALSEALLLAFDAAVRARGARFAVLLVPSRDEVHPEAARAAGRLDYERPRRTLSAFLAEHGVAHLDLAPGLQEAVARADGSRLYFERDLHWTAPGNDTVGELVARFVAELSRGPPGPRLAGSPDGRPRPRRRRRPRGAARPGRRSARASGCP